MFEFLTQWYMIVLEAILGFVLMFHVPVLRTIAMTAFKALLSEQVLIKIFLDLAGAFVHSTKNTTDDAWFYEIRHKLLK